MATSRGLQLSHQFQRIAHFQQQCHQEKGTPGAFKYHSGFEKTARVDAFSANTDTTPREESFSSQDTDLTVVAFCNVDRANAKPLLNQAVGAENWCQVRHPEAPSCEVLGHLILACDTESKGKGQSGYICQTNRPLNRSSWSLCKQTELAQLSER